MTAAPEGSGLPEELGETAADAPGAVVSPALVGGAAVVFSFLYLVSDVVEFVQGGLSEAQLYLTYVAEAAVPLYVLGLYAAQRPRIGRLGLAGALGYAYSFVFFPGTVLYALAAEVPSWQALQAQLSPWILVHGVVMVVSGLCLGLAVVRAGLLPRWTGYALALGMVMVAVASGLSPLAQLVAAAVRDAAFMGMGASLLRRSDTGRR
ncbi:hypothetical protein ATJ97_2064 [Georgenia soli]|uniref:Uncharacterized protein n=1 Tax=Georgenia soli TaxID=638953 RepID=A0A2A9EKS0_9MICO|nr:hypothetical protein [Georgenia soli]PFG39554.1 hypothetical protein ATJ97_2064 [Georgenia soli]